MKSWWQSPISIISAAILLPWLVIFLPGLPGKLLASWLLFAWLPGYAWLPVILPAARPLSLSKGSQSKEAGFRQAQPPFSRPERWLITIALSYALTTMLILLLVFSGLPLTPLTIAGSLSGSAMIGAIISWYRRPQQTTPTNQTISTGQVGLLLLVLALAAFFRLYQVHYSDYQGDEAGILLQAVSLFQGDVEAIMTRFKGPGEVLILNAIGGLTNNFDELTGRLPFSLASTVAVGLVMLLGERLFNRPVGVVAASLATIEGVFVSYARTAQYQNVLLMLSLAAMLIYVRNYQTGGQGWRLPALATFLLSVAGLFHFEALFLLPAALYLTVTPHGTRDGLKSILRNLWPAGLIFLSVTASFYVPFLLHPSLEETGVYLENRIGSGESPPFNNFDHFFYIEALKYNSAYYAGLFNLALIIIALVSLSYGLAGLAGHRHPRRSDRWLAIGTFLSLSIIATGLVLQGYHQLAAGLLAIGAAGFSLVVIRSPATLPAYRLLWLWVSPPLWVYLFLVNRPGKHHYLFWSALLILVAVVIVWLGQRLSSLGRLNLILTGSLGLLIWGIMAGHTVMLLLRTDLEYMLTYPEHQSDFYPTDAAYPYRTRIGFGYPYRLGWQVIGQLKRTGRLEGSWTANDDGNTLDWYMLHTPQTRCYPRYVIRGQITYKGSDDYRLPFEPADFGYRLRYRIWGNDRLRMTVLEFDPDGLNPAPLDLYEQPTFTESISPADFPRLRGPTPPPPPPAVRLEPAPILAEGSEIKNNLPPAYRERADYLDGRIALLGYDVETQYQTILPITLHWQTLTTVNLRYKIFVHLLSADGHRWAQADDVPVCGTTHANSWPAGSIILDRHLLKLPPDLPPGDYQLSIGMYEPQLNLRLNYLDIAGNEQGNSLLIDVRDVAP